MKFVECIKSDKDYFTVGQIYKIISGGCSSPYYIIDDDGDTFESWSEDGYVGNPAERLNAYFEDDEELVVFKMYIPESCSNYWEYYYSTLSKHELSKLLKEIKVTNTKISEQQILAIERILKNKK